MATGIIGTLGANASLSYTPTSNAKLAVGGSVVTVNGVSTQGLIYVGANQTAVVATGASGYAFVSAIEENS